MTQCFNNVNKEIKMKTSVFQLQFLCISVLCILGHQLPFCPRMAIQSNKFACFLMFVSWEKDSLNSMVNQRYVFLLGLVDLSHLLIPETNTLAWEFHSQRRLCRFSCSWTKAVLRKVESHWLSKANKDLLPGAVLAVKPAKRPGCYAIGKVK